MVAGPNPVSPTRSEAVSNPTQARECLVGATIGILVVGLILAGIGFPRRRKRKMSPGLLATALSSLLVPFPFLGVPFSSFAGREW